VKLTGGGNAPAGAGVWQDIGIGLEIRNPRQSKLRQYPEEKRTYPPRCSRDILQV
jgi:hypothetical protein